jgi:hypothetical protein
VGQVLGKVTNSFDGERGPDVLHRIGVPATWLAAGVTIEVELPRHLSCARCEGGGCDVCQRSGALTLRGREEPSELVTVTLPTAGDGADVVLRIPEAGGFPPPDRSCGRGLLLLRVSQAETPSPGVQRADPRGLPLTISPEERRQLIHRSAAVAVGLTALFVVLLWLAGWL